MSSNSSAATSNRTQLLIILLTPLLVMASATLLYFSGWLTPNASSNHGYLLSPVLSVTDLGLPAVPEPSELNQNRQWQVIQFSPNCDEVCLEKLYQQRQIHIALGKDQTRIDRLIITQSDLSDISQDYPGLSVVSGGSMSDLSAALVSRITPEVLAEHPVFVADPFGNVMLYFTSEHDYKEQLDDLDQLLKLSTIG